MVGTVIARLWSRWWLPARVSDGQLMQLTRLQIHDLAALAAAAPDAHRPGRHGRIWLLRRALPAACRLRWNHVAR